MLLLSGAGGIALLLLAWHGPVETRFLNSMIEAAINRQIAPMRAHVGASALQFQPEAGGIALKLSAIDIQDSTGRKSAAVSDASIELDWTSLLVGAFEARSLTLVQPNFTLKYDSGKGLELNTESQSSPARAGTVTAPAKTTDAEPSDIKPALGAQRDLSSHSSIVDTIRSLLSGAGGAMPSRLAALHIRDGNLRVEGAGPSTNWRVPGFDFSVDHRDGRGILVGSGNLSGPSGKSHVTVSAEQQAGNADTRLTVSVDRMVPAELANLNPAFGPLAAMLLPVGGEAILAIDSRGQLASLDMKVGLGHGSFNAGGACADSLQLDRGVTHITYMRGTGRIAVLPSDLRGNGSGATVSGEAVVGKDDQGRDRWQYSVKFADATIGDPAHGLPATAIDHWSAQGTFTPETGEAVLDKMALDAGEARMALTGRASSDGLTLDARVTNAPAAVLVRLWPSCFQPYARNWVLTNVQSGTVSKGHMNVALDAAGLLHLRNDGKMPDDAATAQFDVNDVAFTYVEGLPSVLATRGSMQFSGRKFSAAIPEAASQMPSGRVLSLSNARYEVPDFLDPSPRGRIGFETSGPIETALEFLDLKPLGLIKASGLRYADLIGDFAGKLSLELPVTRPLEPGDLKLQANAKLSDARLRKPVNGLTLNGGSLALTASESNLQIDGDVLVNGVPAKLAWTRELGADSGPSPPLRLTARLDAGDREQLGIFINHMIDGETPVTIDLAAGTSAAGDKIAHVEADLGAAEFVLDTLAWRKPPGEAATASFDLVALDKPGAQASQKAGMRLDDFRLTGDKIAIHGTIDLGPDYRLAAFDFPEFSINLVTRLAVSGTVRPDSVLEVHAHGGYFDGRDFFKSLFSLGQLTAKPLPAPKNTAGLDLIADIDTLLGQSQVALHGVHIEASKRLGLLSALEAKGGFAHGGNVAARLQHPPGKPRILQAEADDAGQAFRLIGLYQSLEGGNTSLQVNLDAQGAAEKTGTLWARQFSLLGDPVVKEVLNGSVPNGAAGSAGEREKFDFDRMRVGFSVGQGQLVINDMYINGPVVGATLRGRIDYTEQTVRLGGTYIPLFGLNSMFGALPVFGELLVGRNGEGLLGITFAIEGSLAKPDVIVNPVSVVAPGIFRQIFELSPEDPRILPRDQNPPKAPKAQASSLPPQTNGSAQPTDIGEAFPPITSDEPPSILLPKRKRPALVPP